MQKPAAPSVDSHRILWNTTQDVEHIPDRRIQAVHWHNWLPASTVRIFLNAGVCTLIADSREVYAT